MIKTPTLQRSIILIIMVWTHRDNQTAAVIVDFGICLERQSGAAVAWAYLVRSGIPEPVTYRVLGDPGRRRAVLQDLVGLSEAVLRQIPARNR